MKNRALLILVCILLFGVSLKAQTYEFFKQIFPITTDTIYLRSDFVQLENKLIDNYITESFIRQEWEPLPTKNLPDIKLFLKNFDLEYARNIAYSNNVLNKKINFDKLDKRFLKLRNQKRISKTKNTTY